MLRARAKSKYGFFERSTATGMGPSSGAARIADAFVLAAADR